MTTYYIDYVNGDDTNTGLTPAAPFQHIPGSDDDTSNAQTAYTNLTGGDVFLLKRGTTWVLTKRLQMLNKGGSIDRPVIYSTYYNDDGTDDTTKSKPIIEGWKHYLDGDWSHDTGTSNVWRATAVDIAARTMRVFFNGVGQRRGATTAASQPTTAAGCNATTKWAYNATANELYIYSGSATLSPTDVYGDITSYWDDTNAKYSVGLYLVCAKNVIYENLVLTGYGIGGTVNYNNVSYTSENITINNCEFYNCIQGITVIGTNIGQTTNLVVKNCVFDTNWHTQENWTDEANGGDGIVATEDLDGCTIENNYIKDFGHSCININVQTGNAAENIIIRDNYITTPNSSYCRGMSTNGINSLVKDIQMYNNTIYNTTVRQQIEGENIYFHNNVVDTVRECTLTDYTSAPVDNGVSTNCRSTADVINVNIYNNTIINTEDICLRVLNTTGYSITSYKAYNNICYNTITGSSDIAFLYDLNTDAPEFLEIYNNCFYSPNTTTTVSWDATTYTVAAADAARDEMYSNIGADPKLTDHYGLMSSSPCIGMGTRSDNIDYTGAYKRSINNDIGTRWANAHEDSTT